MSLIQLKRHGEGRAAVDLASRLCLARDGPGSSQHPMVEQPGYRYRILPQEFQEAAASEQGFESILPQSSGVTFTLSLSEASILQNQT